MKTNHNRNRIRNSGKQASRKVTADFDQKVHGSNGSSESRNEQIILPSGKLSNSEAAKRLFTIIAKYEDLFLYGGRVVEVVASGEDRKPSLSPLDAQAFRSRIEHYGLVYAWRTGANGGWLLKPHARCSMDTANVLLGASGRKLLPHIALMHNCPILTEHGILTKGYHSACGGRLITSSIYPEIMTLEEACEVLLELVSEFNFLHPSDKSRAMAAIISPALKFGELLKKHFPLFLVEADESTAGKGFLLELIQAIYRELVCLVTQAKGGVGGFDESLAQKLINGRPFLQIDNVRGIIDSSYLEAILTVLYGETVAARVPYKPEIEVRPDRFIFQLTSNGFVSTRDLANRSCIIRIKKRHGFAFKRYPEGDISDHVLANQAVYLGAVYRVVSEWLARGKPATADLRAEGKFRSWAQVLDWIVQRIFNLPPLMDGHSAAQNRVSNPGLNWLREICLAVEKDPPPIKKLSASDLVDISHEHSIVIPGLAADASEMKAKLHVGGILGKIFNQEETCECDGFLVRKIETSKYNEASRRTIILKNYTIERMMMQETFTFGAPTRTKAHQRE